MDIHGLLSEPEIWVIGVNFGQEKQSLARVSELSEIELTVGVKMTEKLGQGTRFKLAGEFKLSEFELPGFYCSL